MSPNDPRSAHRAPTRRLPPLLPVVLGAVLVLAAACGGDSGDDGGSGATTSTATAAGDPATGTTGGAGPSATTGSAPEGTTTTTAAAGATSGPSTSAGTAPAHPDVPLRADGLGVTAFGDMPEYALAALTAALGEPSSDTTEPAFSSYGTCPGTTLRAVGWGGLVVLITDGATAYGIESGPHFFAYMYRSDDSLGLATPEGIGLGSTVAEVRAAYGEQVRVNPEQEVFGPSFEVGAYGPGGVYGLLDGTDDTSTVTEVAAGQPCGE